jgi:hypothetical protein
MTKQDLISWARSQTSSYRSTILSNTDTLYHIRYDFANGDRYDHLESGRWPHIEIIDRINGETVHNTIKTR